MKFFLTLFFILFSLQNFPQEQIQYELESIKFEGNKEFSSSDLEFAIYSEETPGWFYKFLNSFTPLGAPPVDYDASNIPIELVAHGAVYKANGLFEPKFSY